MAKNDLLVGVPRLGWFIDGDPDTEMIAVMLRDTGEAIELTIPLQGMSTRDGPYQRWWSTGVRFGDDPDRSKHSYRPPWVLQFHDNDGSVVLVGCRANSSTMSIHAGQGRVVANYAVRGGHTLKYEKINGLRTDIPAFAAWTQLSSMTLEVTGDERNRVKSVKMTLTDAPGVRLARRMNLTMRSSWRTECPRGSFRAYEGVELQTSTSDARAWDEHLEVHGAALDLVSLAAWRPFGYAAVKVHRADDPERSLAGDDMGDRWLPVSTHRLPEHKPWTKEPAFLFPYSEIGPRGVSHWLRIRQMYGQAIGPLLGILRSNKQWNYTNLVQSGIALEALGYLIDVIKNKGAHLNGRNQINFKPSLQVILDDMKLIPVTNTTAWIERAHDAYMGAKHPDRPEPDSLVAMNTLRENILILRYWLALQLGATPTSLSNNLRADPLASEFVLID